MNDAEVHVLWARLLPWKSKDASERARQELDEALARAPRSPEVQFRRAIFFLRHDQLGKAEDELDSALAARPDDPRYLLARGLWWELRQEKTTAGKQRIQVPADLVERLARLATSPAQLQFAAVYRAKQGRFDEGLALIERAIDADPLCWSCEEIHAVLLGAVRRYQDAINAVDRAIAITPESLSTNPLMRLRSHIAKLQAR